MDQLFRAMAILIQYPLLGALVGVILLALGLRAHRATVIVVAIVWLLYGLYETGMQQRWLCTGECNIRVDLLLIYPVLLLSLMAAGVSLIRARKSPRRPA